MASAEPLRVEVVYCPRPGQTDLVSLSLASGATLAHALHASGLLERHGLVPADLRLGIWCKVSDLATPLRDRDRVEIYRALRVDPKEARRQRYQQHKERSGGAAKGRVPTP